jgi:3-dehydroquinate synthase
MTVIRVGSSHSGYDVLVGPVEVGIDRIRDLAVGTTPVLVTEPTVFALYGATIVSALAADPLFVPSGEAAKDWQQLHDLLEQFARLNVGRHTPVVALGGGSVGDLAGLAASLFKRGSPIIHVPTTLLSQADSAIGGKTAIDAFGEKNLVGTFHQPSLVVADPAMLATLDQRQLRSGYAEIVKYGLIGDPAFFAWCEANGRALLEGHADLRLHAITTAIRSKARLVEGDIDDRSGQRALLNLGHSFAHAIEAEAGIGSLLHGEAVALGLTLAYRLSAETGIAPPSDAERVAAHFASVSLPTRLAEVGMAHRGAILTERIGRDKKKTGPRLALVLARGIGRAFVDDSVDPRRLADFLNRSP